MMVEALKSLRDLAEVNGRSDELLAREIAKLWDGNAELRDDLHAVANRVESLTRALMASPADVAAAIVHESNVRRISGDDVA